jgi:hypothetical protein
MRETQTIIRSPVDDITYNLVAALAEKLEGIEAYRKYEQDDPHGETGDLFRDLAATDARDAERIIELLRTRLT